jgi:hypothetical protein
VCACDLLSGAGPLGRAAHSETLSRPLPPPRWPPAEEGGAGSGGGAMSAGAAGAAPRPFVLGAATLAHLRTRLLNDTVLVHGVAVSPTRIDYH